MTNQLQKRSTQGLKSHLVFSRKAGCCLGVVLVPGQRAHVPCVDGDAQMAALHTRARLGALWPRW